MEQRKTFQEIYVKVKGLAVLHAPCMLDMGHPNPGSPGTRMAVTFLFIILDFYAWLPSFEPLTITLTMNLTLTLTLSHTLSQDGSDVSVHHPGLLRVPPAFRAAESLME